MAATSVTGKGRGAADGKNKGSAHMTLGVGHLIGPRIVAAGTVLLDGSGDGTVILPVLEGVSADYVVMLTDNNAAAAAVSGSVAVDTANAKTTITVKGTAAHTIQYAVVKAGLAV